MKHLSYLAAAALTTASVWAANVTYKGPSGGDWMTAANWSSGAVPTSADAILICTNSSVLLSDAALGTMYNLNIGAYTTIGLTGTGSLTISNTSATFGNLVTARVSVQNTAITGVDYLYLNNGSLINFTGTANIGYYSETSVQTLTERQSAEIIVDTTSRLNSASINIGRSTIGTLSLLGSDTVGATVSLGGVIMGSTGGTGADAGSGRIVMGTHSTLTASSISMGVSGGAYSNSIAVNGGTMRITNTLSMNTNSIVTATGGIISTGGNATMSGSSLGLEQSKMTVGGTFSSVNASTLNLLSSSLSVTGAYFTNTGSAIVLTNSSLSVGTTFSASISSNSTMGTSLTLTGSTLSAGVLTFSAASTSSARNALTLTNSSVTVSTMAYLMYTPLKMYNSTLYAGTNLYISGDSANSIQDSTISAGGLELHFGGNATTVSNSLITLTAASAITPIRTLAYTTRLYMTNNASLSMGGYGYLGIGYLDLGTRSTATFSMTGGTASISHDINVGINSGGVGYLSVTGGTITGAEKMFIGSSGAQGTVVIGGTGVIYAAQLTMSGNATISGNVYVQGTQATAITAAGQATFDTMNLGSGATFTNGAVHVAAASSISLAVSGTPAAYDAVSFNTLAIDGAATLNVDYSSLTLSGATTITLMVADVLTGYDNLTITSAGLADGYNVAYSQSTVGSQTALLATITAIPEPAATAALLGLTAVTVLIIRRRTACRR